MTSKMAEEHYKESHKKVQNKQKYFTSINEFKLMCDLNFQTIKEERERKREGVKKRGNMRKEMRQERRRERSFIQSHSHQNHTTVWD